MTLRGWWSRGPAERLTGARLRPKRHRHRLLKAGLWLIGLVALYAVVGFLLVPPVAKYYLASYLSDLLDRQVAIRDIAVNPFALTATVRGVSIQDRGGTEVFGSFDALALNLQAQSIVHLAPILDEIRLERPYVHLVRLADGSYNFTDLVNKFAAKSKEDSSRTRSTAGPRFSFNNIQLVAARVEFEDRPKKAKHVVSDMNIAIPFISNLPYLVDRYVEPSFAGNLNGTPFGINGRTKPFEPSRETLAELNLDSLDIPRYVEYVPVDLGFRIASGVLDARLTANFVRLHNQTPALILAGTMEMRNLALAQHDGRALANIGKLQVPVSIGVFARDIKFGNILVDDPEFFIRRERDGQFNWARVVSGQPASERTEAHTGSEPAAATDADAPSPIKVQISGLQVDKGRVHFADETTPQPFKIDVTALNLMLHSFSLRQQNPIALEASFTTADGQAVKQTGNLLLSPVGFDGAVEVNNAKLKKYEPYYAHLFSLDVQDGAVSLSAHAHVRAAQSGMSGTLSGLDALVTKLRLRRRGASEDFLSMPAASIRGMELDFDKRTVQAAQISSKNGKLRVIRDQDGSIDLGRLLVAQPVKIQGDGAAAGQPRAAARRAKAAEQSSWQWLAKKIALERYAVRFEDRTLPQPVIHAVELVKVALDNLSGRPNSTAKIALELGINKTGKVTVSGTGGINPLVADLQVDVAGVDLVPFQSYLGNTLNIHITKGEFLARGTLAVKSPPSGLALTFSGDLGSNNFASVDSITSEDFLNWKTLYCTGVQATTQPFSLAIDQVALSEFYSRLIIYPNGSLNVQEVIGKKDDAGTTRPPSEASAAPDLAKVQGGPKSRSASSAGSAEKPPPADHAAITVGKLALQDGTVNFTDLFIKPNYSANITDIAGAVTALSSEGDTAADVDVRGRFGRAAPVTIKGKINPLAPKLFMALTGSVRDIELGPFTPYSAKYVGYAIEKGKMSFNVHYRVENRVLTAQNQLILNQLTFGERIKSSTATKLPVLLAVALLTDRNGVINVNLPIKGSLDDPQFSVGGIILKIIFNVIERAVTSPFALIGSLFGGGEELSYIDFDPARVDLSAQAQEKLGKLRTALIERPGLRLNITGRADPETDRDELRRLRLDQEIKAQKLKDPAMRVSPGSSLEAVKIEPQQYEKYLKRAYQQAKFAKPRNLIGIAKDLPRKEMEQLMLTNIEIGEDELIELANERAQAAKDFITGDDQVAVAKVFLLAPKVEAPKGGGKLAGTRVDFSLK